MKRQNELSFVGSDEDNVMENTSVEMKYWCDDKYHNCVMMEQATTNTPARFVFPQFCAISNEAAAKCTSLFNAPFKSNETKETRNQSTTDRSY